LPDKEDYEKIREDDIINIKGLNEFTSGSNLKVELLHTNGEKEYFNVTHSYSPKQIEWFKAGSALNLIKNSNK